MPPSSPPTAVVSPPASPTRRPAAVPEPNWTASRLAAASYRDLGPPPVVGARFLRFLLSSSKSLPSILSLLRSEPSTTRDFSLEIDAFDLIRCDPVLGNVLLRYPATLLPLLEDAIVEAQRAVLRRLDRIRDGSLPFGATSLRVKGERGEGGGSVGMTRVHPRLVHLPPHPRCCVPTISSIVASDVGKIVQISGTVVRTSSVQMYESARAYRCRERVCGHAFVVYADMEQSNNALPAPTVCPCPPSSGGGGGTQRCASTKFERIPGGSVHTDYQEIKLQESASRLSVGSIPRSLLVKLEHDLVDSCRPGDEVFVVGSLMSQWQPVSGNLDCDVSVSLRAHSIRVVHGDDRSAWDLGGGAAAVATDATASGVEELRKEFDAFWSAPDRKSNPFAARNFICRSVCPKLYGMYIVKLGILLTLIGGVSEAKARRRRGRSSSSRSARRGDGAGPADGDGAEAPSGGDEEDNDDKPDQFCLGDSGASKSYVDGRHGKRGGVHGGRGAYEYGAASGERRRRRGRGGGYRSSESVRSRRRDQSHLLLVGDPGTGKSQFLRFAAVLCPRSVLTTGVGTTSAGLTCAAVRDGNGKDFSLEAGALVLADRGVCCIDEIGCIREEERTTIHEAMEQQTLSVAKAGIVCKLNCRATVIAVTNPKGSLYDNQETLSKNTGIGGPLLSRFDLIFKLVDTSNSTRDSNITTYLLNRAIQGSGYDCTKCPTSDPNDTIWSMDKLRGYIATVKDRFQPAVSDDAALLLERHYEKCREVQSSTLQTTIRFFESLIRLSQAHARLMYRDVVTLQDAVAVVWVMECSASTYGGFNPVFVDDPENVLYCDPMGLDFPPHDKADLHFLCYQYKILHRYQMLDRLSDEERREARANMHEIDDTNELGYREVSGPSSPRGDLSGVLAWEDVEGSGKGRTPENSEGMIRYTSGSFDSHNRPSCSVPMIEEKDHYGRSHFSPRVRASPQCKGLPYTLENSPVVACDEVCRPVKPRHDFEGKNLFSGCGSHSYGTKECVHDPDAALVASLERHAAQHSIEGTGDLATSSSRSGGKSETERARSSDKEDEIFGSHSKKKRRRHRAPD